MMPFGFSSKSSSDPAPRHWSAVGGPTSSDETGRAQNDVAMISLGRVALRGFFGMTKWARSNYPGADGSLTTQL